MQQKKNSTKYKANSTQDKKCTYNLCDTHNQQNLHTNPKKKNKILIYMYVCIKITPPNNMPRT